MRNVMNTGYSSNWLLCLALHCIQHTEDENVARILAPYLLAPGPIVFRLASRKA
jgi:hypothetical protein